MPEWFLNLRLRVRANYIVAGIVTAGLFLFAAQRDVFRDHIQHAQFAELLAQKIERPPHFIFHFFVILVRYITSLSFLNSGFVVVGIAVLATFLLLMGYLQKDYPKGYKAPMAVLCLALFFLHPIPLAFWSDKHLYYGYMSANTFHNPTIILLKPIALFHFLLLTKFIEDRSAQASQIFLLATLTALSILAKPSYMMSLMPAVGILLCSLSFQRRSIDKSISKLVLLGIFLPAVILIGWQFLQTYGASPTEVSRWNRGKLVFSPLELFRFYSSSFSFLPKVLGSLAFPLSVAFFHFKIIKHRFDYLLALVNMIVAAAFNYCLLDRACFLCGDFGWSSQIALFLLNCVSLKTFFQSIDFSVEQFPDRQSRLAIAVPMAIFSLHFLSGLFWYASNVIPGRFSP